MKTVHRLVADAFIPNPNGLPVVNHKDNNRKNPHVDNLEWCTQSYNIQYGYINNPTARNFENYYRKEKHYKSVTVHMMDLNDVKLKTFTSIREANDYLILQGLTNSKNADSAIRDCLTGKQKAEK